MNPRNDKGSQLFVDLNLDDIFSIKDLLEEYSHYRLDSIYYHPDDMRHLLTHIFGELTAMTTIFSSLDHIISDGVAKLELSREESAITYTNIFSQLLYSLAVVAAHDYYDPPERGYNERTY